MHDFLLVQGGKTADHLVKDAPDVLFFHVPHSFLVLVDLALQVASVGVLHHDAQRAAALLEESLFVGCHVLVLDGGQDSDLVDGIVFLL